MSLYSNMMNDDWQDENFIDDPEFWELYHSKITTEYENHIEYIESMYMLDDIEFYNDNEY